MIIKYCMLIMFSFVSNQQIVNYMQVKEEGSPVCAPRTGRAHELINDNAKMAQEFNELLEKARRIRSKVNTPQELQKSPDMVKKSEPFSLIEKLEVINEMWSDNILSLDRILCQLDESI